jgi:hypothetical protein
MEPAEAAPIEELAELEAVDESESSGASAEAGFSSTSAQAYELASDLDEDIPFIPESSGLELVDETDITDIIGFIDIDDVGRLEDIDTIDEDFGAEGQSGIGLPRSLQPEFILDDAEESSDDSGLEPAEEEDFQLLLSPIDLSSLEQWESGPAGGAEADATRSDFEVKTPAAMLEQVADELLSDEVEEKSWHIARSAQIDAAGESDDSVLVGDEIPMLSDEMRDLLEFLPAVESEDTVAQELADYLGPALCYCPACRYEAVAQAASEELPVVGEGEPWQEAEYLGEFGAADMDEDVFEGDYENSDGPILYKGGIFQINPGYRAEDRDLDPNLRNLVDSVLGGED